MAEDTPENEPTFTETSTETKPDLERESVSRAPEPAYALIKMFLGVVSVLVVALLVLFQSDEYFLDEQQRAEKKEERTHAIQLRRIERHLECMEMFQKLKRTQHSAEIYDQLVRPDSDPADSEKGGNEDQNNSGGDNCEKNVDCYCSFTAKNLRRAL